MSRISFEMRLAAITLGALLVAAMTGALRAHHSLAMYEPSTTRTLTGKLTRFVPGSNHAQLIFELLGPDGDPVLGAEGTPAVWGVETGSARALASRGVTVESFPEGTILTVTLNPLRDGRQFGALRSEDGVLIGCGTTWPPGGCNEQTGTVYVRGD